MNDSKSEPLGRWQFDNDLACLALIEPWCVAGAATLDRWMRQHLSASPTLAFHGSDGGTDGVSIEALSIESLSVGLLNDLYSLMKPTVELEVQIAILQGDIVDEGAHGNVRQFTQLLQCSKRRDHFWNEYSLLEKRLKGLIKSWVRSTAEMLSRLRTDFEELCDLSLVDPTDQLESLESEAGDRHHHGRRVHVLRFSSGRKLVYKPRNIDAEIAFYDAIKWLGKSGFSLPIRRPVTCAKQSHGWVEFVAAGPSVDSDSRRRLHHRHGGLLAVLHLLHATDITIENLIVCGEHPIVIDAEAICSPFYVATSGSNRSEKDHALSASVMRVGMLPQRAWSTPSGIDVDVSAMAGSDASNYCEDVVAGFREASQLIFDRKSDWLGPDGLIDRLGRLSTRLIARPTRAYGLLLRESTHPDVMRDPAKLATMTSVLESKHASNKISRAFVESEAAAIQRDDIPVFEVDVQSGWVHSCCQSNLVQLQPSPADTLRERVTEWSDCSIERECATIRMALHADACVPTQSLRKPMRSPREATADPVDLLTTTSIEIADRLCSRRYGDDWLDLRLTSNRERWCVTNIQNDLYSGRCGIALALATIGKKTGLVRFCDVAREIIAPVQDDTGSEDNIGVGAFSGLAGHVYTAVHLASLWGDFSWLLVARRWLDQLADRVSDDRQIDVIGGAAGSLCVLANLREHLWSPGFERCESACMDRLLSASKNQSQGMCWPLECFEHRPMTGMAHGNAGIAMALLGASRSSRDTARQAAQDAVAFEQAHYDPESARWKDLRRGSPDAMTAWCHGAPGIGMARLQMLQAETPTPSWIDHVREAVDATLRFGASNSHCLCHGDLGNQDFLTLVAQHHAHILDPDQTLQMAARTAQSIRDNGPRCGTPGSIETPGLMTGLAGIAWGLLRASAPNEIPSVLALEPPKMLPLTLNVAAGNVNLAEDEGH